MSEKNNIFEDDLLMRSILEGGQEEVPARVWDAVSGELDRAARKTVVLRWRRAAMSIAAAAAAVAAVVLLGEPQDSDIVPAAVNENMIAVVDHEAAEPDTEVSEPSVEADSKTVAARLLAYVPERTADIETVIAEEAELTDMTAEPKPEVPAVQGEQEDVRESQPVEKKNTTVRTEQKEYFPTVWDEEKPSRQIRASLVVSGITGTSGAQDNSTRSGMHKAPSIILPTTETGIKERNKPSRYGLPVSAGVGVKIDFTPRWSLGIGLNYTYLSRTFEGTYTRVNELGFVDIPVTSDIRNSQHFIGIPVNAYYNIIDSRRVNFYAYAGGAAEKCVYDKYLVLSHSIIHKEAAKGLQFSANIGLGAEFMIGEYVGLYLDPSLRYYFDCGQPKSIRTEQPLMLGFELGFRFRL